MASRWAGALALAAAAMVACIPARSQGPRGMPRGDPAAPGAEPDSGEPLGCERTADGDCLPGCEELFGAGGGAQGGAGAPPCHQG